MRRTASLWLVASSVVLLFATANARTRPRQGGTLRIEMRADASAWANSSVRMLVFDSLIVLDENGHVQPSLAVRWDSQSDNRRWQFSLRPDVRFHDGTQLSPATVVQSLTAQDCNGCPWRSVHVSGDAVVFESETPIANLPAILANSRYAIARRDDAGNVVGTGVFRYASSANGAVILNAVEDSWHPRPYVNAIEVRGGRSLRDQWMDVGAGRADIVEAPAEQLRHGQQDRMRLLVSRDTDLLALVVNADDPAAQDPRIREALALSLDRAALLNVVFQKQGEVTASVLPNWLTGYSFAFPAAPNVTKARDLRAQVARQQEMTISVDGNDPLLQLIADRLVLNGRDAGLIMRTQATQGRSTLRLVRVHVEESSPAAAFADATSLLAPGVPIPADDVVAVFHADEALIGKRNVIPLLYTPRAVAISSRIHEVKLAGDGSLRAADFWLEDGK